MSYPKLFQSLKDHFDERFDRLEAMLKPAAPSEPERHSVSTVPIDVLGLPTKQEKSLIAAGYKTLGDLEAQTDDAELMAVDGVGKRTVEFIRQKIHEFSLFPW